MIRRDWTDLPVGVRRAVEAETGPVVAAETASAGRHSGLSATLHMDAGKVFCKGITVDHPFAQMHRNEARVNPFLPPSAPRLRWQIETDGWLLHGFEHVSGRHADLSPGSPDLPLVTDAVAEIGRVAAPPGHRSIAVRWSRIAAWHHLERNPPDDLDPWSRANLRQFVVWENRVADLLAGDRLLHTDLHSLNILVGDTARIIDWAWWRTGAPFVDVGFLVLRLIEAGHTPAEAERVADAVPAWADAPGDARTGFAVAALGIWEQLQRDDPLPMRPAWTATARRWARHRLDG